MGSIKISAVLDLTYRKNLPLAQLEEHFSAVTQDGMRIQSITGPKQLCPVFFGLDFSSGADQNRVSSKRSNQSGMVFLKDL
jgi:hypothetical protein